MDMEIQVIGKLLIVRVKERDMKARELLACNEYRVCSVLFKRQWPQVFYRTILKYMAAVLWVLCAFSCARDDPNTVKSEKANHQEQKFLSDQQRFQKADVVCYVEILKVDKEIERPSLDEPPPPGKRITYPEQMATVKCLRLLKGPDELQDVTFNVLKQASHFFLREKQRRVLYLSQNRERYSTIGIDSGESRLPSALSISNTLKDDYGSGIVVGILADQPLENLNVHILQGRQKAPISLHTAQWKDALIKKAETEDFGIAEIPLESGSYSVLLQLDERLYTFSRLVNGYYPYVILDKNQWRPVYFAIEDVVKD